MSFIKNYQSVFRILFIFGICPYNINIIENRVQCCAFKLFYTIFYYIVMISVLFYFASKTFFYDGFANAFNGTVNISSLLEAFIVLMVYNATIVLTIKNCPKQIKLINRLNVIYIKTNELCASNNRRQRQFFKQICMQLLILLTCHISTLLIALYEYGLNEHFYEGTFYHVFTWVMGLLFLFAMHIRNLANIMLLCFRTLYFVANEMLLNAPFERTESIWRPIQLMLKLCELKEQISDCFGVQLIFASAADIILGTTAVFFLAVQFFQYSHLHHLLFIVAYILPNFMKNFLVASTMDRLGQQVNSNHIQLLY